VYASDDAMLLGTARVVAGELIPGRLLSPIEIEQMKQNRHCEQRVAIHDSLDCRVVPPRNDDVLSN
jgi:hypothetical protein